MKMKQSKFIKLLTAAAAIAVLSGCGNDSGDNTQTGNTPEQSVTASAAMETPADVEILNFIPPQAGEKIAVINVRDYGEIKIKLFPEAASAGVENFTELAEMNYYDELIFHRVIPSFMIQGGDPRGDGKGGSSIWGSKFDGGIPEGLYHFSGAVAYANSTGPATNGSQFYIVNTQPGEYSLGGYRNEDGSIHYYETFEEAGYNLPANVQEMYREKGGTPSLDGGYTVFGQVFEGLDIVRSIAQVETNDDDKPLTQVVMESVRIVEYEG